MKKIKVAPRKVKQALHEEKEAIKGYRADAKKVDTKTARLFREISRDEEHHKRQLEKRLKALDVH